MLYSLYASPLFRGSVADEAVASENQALLEAKLDGYETILRKYKCLGGNVRSDVQLFLSRVLTKDIRS